MNEIKWIFPWSLRWKDFGGQRSKLCGDACDMMQHSIPYMGLMPTGFQVWVWPEVNFQFHPPAHFLYILSTMLSGFKITVPFSWIQSFQECFETTKVKVYGHCRLIMCVITVPHILALKIHFHKIHNYPRNYSTKMAMLIPPNAPALYISSALLDFFQFYNLSPCYTNAYLHGGMPKKHRNSNFLSSFLLHHLY